MHDDVPDAASISESDGEFSDDDLSDNVESRDATDCCDASEGASSKDKLNEFRSETESKLYKIKIRLPRKSQDLNLDASKRILGEDAGPEFIKLAAHPDLQDVTQVWLPAE